MSRLAVLTVFVMILSALGGCVSARAQTWTGVSSGESKPNLDGVNMLLDLLDTIVVRNPDYLAFAAWAKSAESGKVDDSLQALARRNDEDPEIRRMITLLLYSPAYSLYYAQFRNVDPSVHRQVFCSLPYRGIPSPGDIGSTMFELCRNRDKVRAWSRDVVAKVNLERCHKAALEWLPEGDYPIPTIYFMYDGNGGAFARQGAVGFDLFGSILGSRPESTRFSDLSNIGVGEMERTLTHEFFHVYAGRYIYPAGRNLATWQDRMMDRLVRGMVNEGIAMHCNPPTGFKKVLWEDTITVAYWIKEVNVKFALMKSGKGDDAELQQWLGDSYHKTAEELLMGYLKRRYPDGDQRKLRWEHISERPDLEHTLGWWMVSRIYGNGKNKDKVLQLLSSPHDLFRLYNASLGDAPAPLKARI